MAKQIDELIKKVDSDIKEMLCLLDEADAAVWDTAESLDELFDLAAPKEKKASSIRGIDAFKRLSLDD
ncbi:MAG: hypothetical protein ACXADY_26300 [Candidatus Hodarchaeales archaeon]